MAVTVAVPTPRPTLREAVVAPCPPRRTAWPSEAPEMSTTAASRPSTTRIAVPTPPTVVFVAQ